MPNDPLIERQQKHYEELKEFYGDKTIVDIAADLVAVRSRLIDRILNTVAPLAAYHASLVNKIPQPMVYLVGTEWMDMTVDLLQAVTIDKTLAETIRDKKTGTKTEELEPLVKSQLEALKDRVNFEGPEQRPDLQQLLTDCKELKDSLVAGHPLAVLFYQAFEALTQAADNNPLDHINRLEKLCSAYLSALNLQTMMIEADLEKESKDD